MGMRWARPGALARLAGLAVALTALAGCRQATIGDRITSLAVLPADVAPYHQLTERAVGEYLTQALAGTSYRVVGAPSTTRLLVGGRGQELYRRFRGQASTGPEVSLPVAKAMADTVNAQGLLFPTLQVSTYAPVEGRVALTVAIFDRYTGRRVWRNRRERTFIGQTGDPGFLRVVREMAVEIIETLPAPAVQEDFR